MRVTHPHSKQTDRWDNTNVDSFLNTNVDSFLRRSGVTGLHRSAPLPSPRALLAPIVGKGSPGGLQRILPRSARIAAASAPVPSSSSSSMISPLERLLDHRMQLSASVKSVGSSRVSSGKAGFSGSQWFEDMPSPVLFAANKPCSAADAAVLNRWVTGVLDRYAEKMAAGEEGATSSRMVDELVPLLSLGLHDLVRQVSRHCSERGEVLEKIWGTYVELFDKSLAESKALMLYHKARTSRVDDALQSTKREMVELQNKCPAQIAQLSKTLAAKFGQRQEKLEATLERVGHENATMRQLIKTNNDSRQAFFPSFDKYKNSSFKDALQLSQVELPTTTGPESRLAADFKRILQAMPFDERRRVGFFVSSLLGLGTELLENPDTIESVTEQKEHNIWTIGLLEQRIKELEAKNVALKGEGTSRSSSKNGALKGEGTSRGSSKNVVFKGEGTPRASSKEGTPRASSKNVALKGEGTSRASSKNVPVFGW